MTTNIDQIRPTARLDWSLYVDCPNCSERIDVVEYDSDHDCIIAKLIFSNRWDEVSGCDCFCPKCEHEFELGNVEY